MFRLRGHRWDVSLTCGPLLFCVGASFHSAVAPVVTHSVVDLGHSRLIHIVDDGHIHVGHRAVVVKMIVVPTPAFIAVAEVPKAIADAAVETYRRAPIPFMEKECAPAPAPVSRSPEVAHLWRFHPRSRNPVISTIIGVRPISRRPDVAVARANWLFVHWQRRWAERYGNADLRKRRGRKAEKCSHHQQQRTNGRPDFHRVPSAGSSLAYPV